MLRPPAGQPRPWAPMVRHTHSAPRRSASACVSNPAFVPPLPTFATRLLIPWVSTAAKGREPDAAGCILCIVRVEGGPGAACPVGVAPDALSFRRAGDSAVERSFLTHKRMRASARRCELQGRPANRCSRSSRMASGGLRGTEAPTATHVSESHTSAY